VFGTILFICSAIFTICGAVMVAVSKNVIHASIYLLISLIGVAGLYLTLGADFVAVTQLVVYVGGVVILMLFAIMLTGGADLKVVSRYGFTKDPGMGSLKTYVIGGLTSLFMAIVTGKLIYNAVINTTTENQLNMENSVEQTVSKIGTLLVTKHVLAFEISSVLLLGALVGAAIIARPVKLGDE